MPVVGLLSNLFDASISSFLQLIALAICAVVGNWHFTASHACSKLKHLGSSPEV
jgi:hypothetical protein